ncbi:MOSC N-terminal beta barrel domain-containing protein [Streptomyces sp. MS2A]|uniref:MOSC domain-containing protein n=1 Tax=Streptomyces sp. enrichment culture TaxID=1795815 RepID=UPI001380998E|nr:MOSC N-terminal beta barrel domain-containing protein [Streptomyces sp. MS2A]MYS55688.1 MOSC domain-containing protein [Streptomyces sp. SID6013]
MTALAPRIAELAYYPVKGCAAVRPATAVITPAGIAHDRAFLVVDRDGVFRTQRRHPQLALISPQVSPDGSRMTLRHPDLPALSFAVVRDGPRRPVELFGNAFQGIDQGPDVGRWLSRAVGEEAGLVRVPPDHRRVTDGHTPGTSGYADSSAVHILSRATLALLDERLRSAGEPTVPMERFRPNIVVEGWERPHTEDLLRRVTIGGCELGYAKLALRCVVTTVDQRSARKAGPEPLRTLAGYRRTRGGVAFGAKFAVVRPGAVAVGDPVEVAEWGASEL